MKFKDINRKEIGLYVVLLLAGLLIGYFMFSGSAPETDEDMAQHVQEEHTDEDGEIVYTCPMHPSVREDEPGDCPICGMELVRADDVDDGEVGDYSMVMSERAVNLARIQTTEVIEEVPQREIELPGRVQVDERRINHVTADFPGRIRNLEVNFTGQRVDKGDVMAEIYSPEVVATQRELLQAYENRENNPRMYESARQKLRQWEFTDRQINRIEERGEVEYDMEVYSPVDGFVLERRVASEEHVGEGTIMYMVVDLDDIWINLEAYEEDIAWLQEGDPITFQSRSFPGETFDAEISYINPDVDPVSRTVNVRADFNNTDGRLKPEMLVRGNVSSDNGMGRQMMVPASSVLWTGPRSLVYVKDTEAETPRFEVREVELGHRAGDHYVIRDGVQPGEEVVFHGAFRIDSEMQLQDRFSMMNREPGTGAVPAGHDHGDRDDADDHEEMDMETEEPEVHEHTDAVEGTTDEFRDEFRGLLEHYLAGKSALFESDRDEVDEAFQRAAEELESIGRHRMDGDAHMKWMEQYEALEDHFEHIRTADELEEQREIFATMSHVLIEAVRNYEISGVVYHQHCPMADADWLNEQEDIQNPYMPEDMPGCGEVIERLEF